MVCIASRSSSISKALVDERSMRKSTIYLLDVFCAGPVMMLYPIFSKGDNVQNTDTLIQDGQILIQWYRMVKY